MVIKYILKFFLGFYVYQDFCYLAFLKNDTLHPKTILQMARKQSTF